MKLISIQEIFDKYECNPQLQEHMLRVAYLAKLICERWDKNGPIVNKNKLITALLVHDLGNIVKTSPTDAIKNQPGYKENLERLQKRYGMDDHIATLNIMCELGMPVEIIQYNMTKTFIMNERTALFDDFNLKIGAYCDQRMAPDGIMPVLDRLTEAKERAGNNPYSSMNHPRVQQLIESAIKIEQQILRYVKLPSNKALNTLIEKNKDTLRNYLIETDTNIIQPKMKATIEIPKFSKVKYGYKNNELVFEADLQPNTEFPFNYGFIPFTLEDDEEELDVFVIDNETLTKSKTYEVTILGAIEMFEDGVYDPKLIGALDENIISSESELQNYAEEVKQFLSKYKSSRNQNIVFGETLDGYDALNLVRKTLLANRA